MKSRLFGTDGIRGRAFEPPLDRETVTVLGSSLSHVFIRHTGRAELLLAGDTRASTGDLAAWLNRGIADGGGRVTWGGVLPTPAVSFLLATGNWSGGIVISASHNPAEDNGIKVLSRTGEKAPVALENEIEDLLASDISVAESEMPRMESGLAGRYRSMVLASLPDDRPLAGARIVLDAANGAASGLADEVLRTLGAEVLSIASTPDGHNINAGVGATAPETTAAAVVEARADAGLALDGDADRAILIDEKGRTLDGDDILFAWGSHLDKVGRLPGRQIVATVMSNFGLEAGLAEAGIDLVRCAVGDRAVWQTMVEHDIALGGEQSGHIICRHYGVTGDGLLTGVQLLALAATNGRRVSELSTIERMPQVLLNVPVGEKRPFGELPEVRAALGSVEQRIKGRGRVLLRYSGTEPLARVMLEGNDRVEIHSLAEELADVIGKALPR
jgi:phosphoglucosamine mutase